MSAGDVPIDRVEEEFWRLVCCVDEDVSKWCLFEVMPYDLYTNSVSSNIHFIIRKLNISFVTNSIIPYPVGCCWVRSWSPIIRARQRLPYRRQCQDRNWKGVCWGPLELDQVCWPKGVHPQVHLRADIGSQDSLGLRGHVFQQFLLACWGPLDILHQLSTLVGLKLV